MEQWGLGAEKVLVTSRWGFIRDLGTGDEIGPSEPVLAGSKVPSVGP
jgi:hypothetical protein